jgi:hypothetical protein
MKTTDRHPELRQSLASSATNALRKYADARGILPETITAPGVTVRDRTGRVARYRVTLVREGSR